MQNKPKPQEQDVWKQAEKFFGPYVYQAFHPKRKPKKKSDVLSGLGKALL